MAHFTQKHSAPDACAAAPRWVAWAVALVISLATFAAYRNTFSAPFVFDDLQSITFNPTIRQFGTALNPPGGAGETVGGRPLLNLSFAINHAISGREVWSYHAGNLVIHVAAGLVLFGLMRRTLLLPALRPRFGGAALPVACVTAAVWLLHPLQTGAVTYVVQRAESLMALFYLLTLYCFVRGGRGWLALSVVCCALGMACKEVMVSAPLIVLLYDRALVAGSFREAWARRKGFYLALAATWLLLAWLVVQAGTRGNTAGFGGKVGVWSYLLTQAGAISIYLKLIVWPAGQIFDYGTATVKSLADVWPQAVLIAGLAGAAVWLLVRRPIAGLAAFFVFAVLAPSSSFVPVWTEPVAEHRMYLPLAAIVAGAAAASWLWAGRKRPLVWGCAWCAAGVALFALTVRRNAVYETELSLWGDTVRKAPGSARANNNYAKALAEGKNPGEALAYCRRAIDLDPEFSAAYNNCGYTLSKLGRFGEALPYFDKALGLRGHGMEIVLCNRGYALYCFGRLGEALADCEAALKIRPDYEEALSNYGNALHAAGRSDEALVQLDKAIALAPGLASAWNNRGNIFSARGADREEALRCYKRAAALAPAMWEALDNAGRYALSLGRNEEALPYLETAVAHAPDEAAARCLVATALARTGRFDEAAAQAREALRVNPQSVAARELLSRINGARL